jgi:uncharacterized protein
VDYPQYDPRSANSPLSDDELQGLDALLLALPADGAMNIEGMDGYLTALLVGPLLLTTLPTADWLPLVWGGDGEGTAPFPSGQKRKRSTVLVLRHLQNIACVLRDQPEAWEPIFSVAEDGARELADAQDWCRGFLQAVDLAPQAWQTLFDDPTLASALLPVVLLGGDAAELSGADLARLADPEVVDQLSRTVADTVLLLNARQAAAAP